MEVLHIAEHGEAPDENVRKWQNRINPIWKRIAGGCHVNRPIPKLIEEGGFKIEDINSMNGMRELDAVLTAAGIDLTGWTLTRASAISGDGLTVAGVGINPSGDTEAWIAVFDAPAVPNVPTLGLPGRIGLVLLVLLVLLEQGKWRGRAAGGVDSPEW
jgi:hypothetical protein